MSTFECSFFKNSRWQNPYYGRDYYRARILPRRYYYLVAIITGRDNYRARFLPRRDYYRRDYFRAIISVAIITGAIIS